MSAYTPLGIAFTNTTSPADILAASAAYQEGRQSITNQSVLPTLPLDATPGQMRIFLQNFANGQSDQRVEDAVVQAHIQSHV